jgi:hypothetical protein
MGRRLRRTDLRGADFTDADLRGTDLRRANLKGNYFKDIQLNNADFKGALMHDTILANNDMSGARNLDSVRHYGPSKLGIDTVDRSKGRIPEGFLRGCGFSDWEIEQSKLYREDLTSNDIVDIHNKIFELKSKGAHPHNRCVIMCSRRDEDFAKSLHEHLRDEGIPCWRAPDGAASGWTDVPQPIDLTGERDNRLLILSHYSMTAKWLPDTVKRVRYREKIEDRQILFPVRLVGRDAIETWELLDPETGTDLAALVRAYEVADFSRWREDGTSITAFKKLLAALKA